MDREYMRTYYRRFYENPCDLVVVESDTRLARVDEEYDLLRKFANYHFSSLINADATIDDCGYVRNEEKNGG